MILRSCMRKYVHRPCVRFSREASTFVNDLTPQCSCSPRAILRMASTFRSIAAMSDRAIQFWTRNTVAARKVDVRRFATDPVLLCYYESTQAVKLDRALEVFIKFLQEGAPRFVRHAVRTAVAGLTRHRRGRSQTRWSTNSSGARAPGGFFPPNGVLRTAWIRDRACPVLRALRVPAAAPQERAALRLA